MEKEIVVVEATPLAIQGDIAGLKARYETLVEATRQVLQEGIDFGVIPGTNNKPVLLKPGAEKLTTLFRLRPAFTLQDAMEDWEKGRFYYRYRCTLYNTAGESVGDGEGSCNTLEKKYRWRDQQRTCPTCGQAAIIKGRQEYGGGWLCWKKRGGCNAKFQDGDQRIEGQKTGQIENPEPYDLINTVQKMAQKRALVAVVLVVTGASAFFTQDLDDFGTTSSSRDDFPPGEEPTTGQKKSPPPPPPARSKHHSADPVTGEVVKAGDSRPHAPDVLRDKIIESIARRRAADFRFPAGKLKDFQGAVRSNLEACFAGDKNSTDKRHLVLEYLTGDASSKGDDAKTKALHRWLNAKPDGDGNWTPDAMAIKEAALIAREAAKEAGQTEMELPEEPARTFSRAELIAQWEKVVNDARALGIAPPEILSAADATNAELSVAIDRLTVEIVAEEGKINLE